MKAILIDAYNKTISEMDIKGDLQSWYDALDVELLESAHYFENGDCVLVDEEGLLKPCNHFFCIAGSEQIFAGSGLVVGYDDQGEALDCASSADEMAVLFMDRDAALQSSLNKRNAQQLK